MIKILVVLGTRPEVIKLAPVIRLLKCKPDQFQVRICVTAQHRQLLDQMLNLFEIVPDVDLNLMEAGQTPTQVAAKALSYLEPVLIEQKPDWMLVQGDTTTVMAAAIAGYYNRVRVGHVEAGLRTGDRWNPFPEEINRIVADALSDLYFAPTEGARHKLLHEGVASERIHVTGNTGIDALLEVAARPWEPLLGSMFATQLNQIDLSRRKLILVTAHRRENFGKPLGSIYAALKELAQRQDLHILYPVHPNPNVWDLAHSSLKHIPNITLTSPLDYQELVYVLKHSFLVMTDSGGLQEEAPSLGKPVLILREKTERPEGVEAGVAQVVGTITETIVSATNQLLDDPETYSAMSKATNPYGDGHAAERILKALVDYENE